IWYDEDIHDLISVETEFPAIAFNNEVSSEKTLYCEPTISSLNDEIDFSISFDDSDDEDYTVIFDKNSFSYKIISTNDLKTDSKNINEKVNLPSLPSPEPTISCFDDLDFFKDFENEFPAIVYNNAQTSKSESILSPQHIDEFDLNDKTSLFKYDKEEQNVLYFNDLFPFNIIHPDDLKSKKDNDGNEIDIIQSLGDMAPLPPREQRHPFFRYQGLEYTDADVADFEERIVMEHRDDAIVVSESERMIPRKGDLHDYWRDISTDGDFLGHPHSYTLIRDPVLRLCQRMMAHSIAGRSQAPEKAWVALGPERQPDAATGAPRVAQDAPAVDEGVQADPEPEQAPQQPPPPPLVAARTMPQRLERLKEEVQGLRRDVGSLRGLVERSMTDQGRFSTWMISCMAQLMKASGQTYQAFDGTFRGSSPGAFQRRTRRRTDGASTSTAQQDQQQPDP
ncbi:hypothetical protein Tco_0066795, partial [Tanacetum coccineum]